MEDSQQLYVLTATVCSQIHVMHLLTLVLRCSISHRTPTNLATVNEALSPVNQTPSDLDARNLVQLLDSQHSYNFTEVKDQLRRLSPACALLNSKQISQRARRVLLILERSGRLTIRRAEPDHRSPERISEGASHEIPSRDTEAELSHLLSGSILGGASHEVPLQDTEAEPRQRVLKHGQDAVSDGSPPAKRTRSAPATAQTLDATRQSFRTAAAGISNPPTDNNNPRWVCTCLFDAVLLLRC